MKTIAPETSGIFVPVVRFDLLDLHCLQGWNEKVYGIANDRYFDPMTMAVNVNKFAGRCPKAASPLNFNSLGFYSAMTFSWLLGLANKLHFALADEVWKKYPGSCPHCGRCPCGCKDIRHSHLVNVVLSNRAVKRPSTITEYQKMLANIYPANTIDGQAKHLMQEVAELQEAIGRFYGRKNPADLPEVADESADVFANLCGLNTCADIDLAQAYAEHFSEGCQSCHQVPCIRCGYDDKKTVC